jgi:hypothetical protein
MRELSDPHDKKKLRTLKKKQPKYNYLLSTVHCLPSCWGWCLLQAFQQIHQLGLLLHIPQQAPGMVSYDELGHLLLVLSHSPCWCI